MRRILIWINIAFSVLVISLGALVSSYWYGVLEPRLRQEAGSNAALLAQAQSGRLADVLSGTAGPARGNRLIEAMDEILTFADVETGTPFFRRIELEVDYETLAVEFGSLDLH